MFRLTACAASAAALAACLALGAQPTATPSPEHPAVGHPQVPRPSAEWPKAKAEDVVSIDAIVGAYYASTAGKALQPRDWVRFRSLFVPDARLIPARQSPEGASAIYLSVTDFVEQNRNYMEKSGFADREIARRTESFGSVAQVWSTYESRRDANDPAPYVRGVASIQLLKDGARWWIVNVFWDFERPDSPIPEKYLKSPKE